MSTIAIPPRDIWTPTPTWARPRRRRKRSRYRWLDRLMKLPAAFSGINRRKCCCDGVFELKKCCDGTTSATHVIGGITPPYYFRFDNECWYAGASTSVGSLTELTPDDVTPFDSCNECNTREAKRCLDDSYSDIGVTGVCSATPAYFRQGGTCYYVSNTHRYGGSIPNVSDSVTITNCADVDCCFPFGDCTRSSMTFEVTISGLTMCTACGVVPPSFSYKWKSGQPNGTFTLTYDSTFDDWCYQSTNHFEYDFHINTTCSNYSGPLYRDLYVIAQASGSSLNVLAVVKQTGLTCSTRGISGTTLFNVGTSCAENGDTLTGSAVTCVGTENASGTPSVVASWTC